MSNLTVENVYTRQSAKMLAKKHFWKLMGMMLIVALIVYGILLGSMLLLTVTGDVSIDTVMTYESSYNDVPAGVSPGFIIGYIVLVIVITLVGSGLGMGLLSAMIDLCRGDESVTVGRVFSRMGQCLKAFGLSLWVSLKVFLWMLPGYAALFALMMIGVSAENAGVTGLLALLGMIIIFALVIPAAFRYLLSTYVMADEPERGIRESVSLSKTMMKGHKWQAFKLIIPVILIMYLVIFGVMLVVGLATAFLVESVPVAGAIIAVVMFIVFLALIFYYAIRMELCYCLFYLNRRGELDAPAAEDTEAGV